MDYYIDITCKSSKKKPLNITFNAMFHNLHCCLEDCDLSTVGFSYPKRNEIALGQVIRLHGSQADLVKILECQTFPIHSTDYILGKIRQIPENCQHIVIRRNRPMDNSRLRRIAKRECLSEAELRKLKIKFLASGLSLPYVEIPSKSSGQKVYRRYYEISSPADAPTIGIFNTFGEGKNGTTVPDF
ncbi:type I-F CRISPR-associated endoribonuclease Cas6/Csy4 [Photobacterium kishitanii]|nr:type I-F CRISPR-associated endoribonuclease Cas6/Csy4 [Photobacterium kishitanii]